MLMRLIYASEAVQTLSPGQVDDILRTARARNQQRDITGLLAFDYRCFLQLLEGDREALSDLYARLLRDARHGRLLLIHCAPIDERQFSDWSMGYVAAGPSQRRLLLRHTQSSQFDPYRLGPASAVALLTAMSQAGQAEAGAPALSQAA